MITAPLNNCFVTIEKKYYDSTTFESGVTLYHDTTYHPEQHAMLEGTVVSVPQGIQERADYEGMSMEIVPGDKILMRYDVVFAYNDQPDRTTPLYKNLLFHDGFEYWRVDIQKIFAVVRQEEIKMLNGYVMCQQHIETIEDGVLVVPEAWKKKNIPSRMTIRNIGPNPADLRTGDQIACIPGVAQQYTINMDTFWIIRQSHIVGKYTYNEIVRPARRRLR